MTTPEAPEAPAPPAIPLARASVVTAIAAVPFGLLFAPQVLALALALLSLAREGRAGRRPALIGLGLAILLTIVWGIALGAIITAWATHRTG